jgi:rubrerythrin
VLAAVKGLPATGTWKIQKRRYFMPEFSTVFSGLKNDRKLTDQELIRAIRFNIAAEYEAIQLYMQLAESIDNELAKRVLIDIANEERVHAGEFLKLLKALAPDEEKYYQEGYEEVEEMMQGKPKE